MYVRGKLMNLEMIHDKINMINPIKKTGAGGMIPEPIKKTYK
jgi:hypothetical protein